MTVWNPPELLPIDGKPMVVGLELHLFRSPTKTPERFYQVRQDAGRHPGAPGFGAFYEVRMSTILLRICAHFRLSALPALSAAG